MLKNAIVDLLMSNAVTVARTGFVCIAIILGAVSASAVAQNGHDAELRQCVADMQASLHGRSILGSRDTAAYIQYRGWLENKVGVTEYDVMVGHCQAEIYRRHATQLQQSRTGAAKHRHR